MSDETQNIPQEPSAPAEASAAPKKAAGNKPVVIYIMILFIVAFLLMALSFLMHQRSNTEALGQLQNSVTAIQEVQATQEENIALQEQLSDLQRQLDDTVTAYDNQLKALVGDLEQKQLELEAMTELYLLEQTFQTKDLAACQEQIARMETQGTADALPAASNDGDDPATSPADRFLQLKEAVQEELAP